MKRGSAIKLIWLGAFIHLRLAASAQSSDGTNLWAAKPVVINGIADEWKNPLDDFNNDTKIAYAISNDDSSLYIIVESDDELTTRRILVNGITITINPAGKKKEGAKITFPIIERGAATGQDHQQVIGDMLASLKTVKVSGFKDIPDGDLPLVNNYSVKAAASFDQKKELVCELSLPLSRLNIKAGQREPVAYNFKVNGFGKSHDNLAKPVMASNTEAVGRMGGRGGMGGGGRRGGGMGSGRGGYAPGNRPGQGNNDSKVNDFWVKYQLATS